MKRLIPSPPLSLALFVVWVLLNQSLHVATLLLAAILAIVVPLITQGLRPATVRMRKPGVALRLAGIALMDMVHSALTVANGLVLRPRSSLCPAFVVIPLDVRDPNALAVLAMILCLAPGTAWGEVALDRSTLLVHVFDLIDEQDFIDLVKTRYERPLMEIFES